MASVTASPVDQPAASSRERLAAARRIVVKIGSALVVDPGTAAPRTDWLASVAEDTARLRAGGAEVVLVSSGAVSAGLARLGLDHRPRTPEEKQAVAAVGQSDLMAMYERFFSVFGHTVGQILMTRRGGQPRPPGRH